MTCITRLKAIALMLIMIAVLSQKQPASKAATPAAATTGSAGALDGTNEPLTGCAGVSFSEAFPPVACGPNPSSVVSGDFNLDGKSDLAVASSIATNNVTILLGDGKGAFTPPAGSPLTVGPLPVWLAVGDFDLDGKPDLTVASGGVTVLLGDGNGGFSELPGSPVTALVASVYVADFNLDGKPELAVVNKNNNSITVQFNTCTSRTGP